MFKSIAILFVLVVCGLFAAQAAPINEASEVKTGMSDAFRRGMNRFGTDSEEINEPVVPSQAAGKPRIFSHYTAKLSALGGGKPRINDQYRKHGYLPLAPSVLPNEHPVLPNGKLTPEAAAKIYVPKRPFQFSTDKLW